MRCSDVLSVPSQPSRRAVLDSDIYRENDMGDPRREPRPPADRLDSRRSRRPGTAPWPSVRQAGPPSPQNAPYSPERDFCRTQRRSRPQEPYRGSQSRRSPLIGMQ
jgi:hypothetical protein